MRARRVQKKGGGGKSLIYIELMLKNFKWRCRLCELVIIRGRLLFGAQSGGSGRGGFGIRPILFERPP